MFPQKHALTKTRIYQSKILRLTENAPWYVNSSNLTLHFDIQNPTVDQNVQTPFIYIIIKLTTD